MKLLRLLLVPFALLAVAAMRIAHRLGYTVKIMELWSERIGHLAGNTECFLAQQGTRGVIGFHRAPPANAQLGTMIARAIPVDPTPFTRTLYLCNQLFPGWQPHIGQPAQLDRDIANAFERTKPSLSFTGEEESFGWRWCKENRIGPLFVCVIVRDGAYLKEKDYHRYRDADIETYIPAMNWLAEYGYTVLRMGAAVEKPLPPNLHPRIRDYATNGMRSEFMDMWLGANCNFCISTGCGFDAIPYVFRRPTLYTNYVPVEYLFTFAQKSIGMWKHHEKDGKHMTFEEIIKSGAGQFMQAKDFEQAGITLIDNSPQELLAATQEMVAQCEGRTSIAKQDFWEKYPRNLSPFNAQPLHGEIRMRIGREFLKGYA